jgi:prepilin-type N-terminal cleavage/methylation domain-containing protein
MPLMRSRAGFTLVELMIALTLLGIVGAVTVRLLSDTQRVTAAQGERAHMQTTTRIGALVVPTELREINPAMGDLTAMSDTSIEYRGMRNLGISCTAPTPTQVLVSAASVGGLRPFQVGDSLLVFVEVDKNEDIDDRWGLAEIRAVTAGNICPGGAGSIQLTLNPANGGMNYQDAPGVTVTPSELLTGAPVRAFEHMTMSTYTDGNSDNWLAMKTGTGGNWEPLVGPLPSTNGIHLDYFDALGNVTATTTLVRSIGISIRGETTQPVYGRDATANGPQLLTDTLSTRVTLRNAL